MSAGDDKVGPATLFPDAHRQPNVELKEEAVKVALQANVRDGRLVAPFTLTDILNEDEPYRRFALAALRDIGVSVEVRVLKQIVSDERVLKSFGAKTRTTTERRVLNPTKGNGLLWNFGQRVAGMSVTQIFMSYAKGVHDVEVRPLADERVRLEEVAVSAAA